jgi:hypothetical protein
MNDPLPTAYFFLALGPKVAVRANGLVSIDQGNHNAHFDREASSAASPVTIYHYPVRSAAQLETKIRQGGEAYERNTEFSQSVGWHWRRWYQLLKRDGIDAVLTEALPSREDVDTGLESGDIIEDTALAYNPILLRRHSPVALGGEEQ